MASCSCPHTNKGTFYDQSLSEIEFQRGIWQATLDNDLSRVKKLLNNGCDINSTDSSGYTALHYAARNNHIDIVRFLISNGACVNCTTRAGGETPLHRAAYMGNLEIIQLLVSNGGSVLLQNNDGQTCLHKACQRDHYEIVRFILTYEPKVKFIKDKKSQLPVDYCSKSNIKELLD